MKNARQRNINDSYLSPFKHSECLKVGDAQSMWVQPTDPRSFYLSSEEREARRNDVRSNDIQKKKHTKKELCDKFFERTDGLTKLKYTLKELQQMAAQLNIPLEYYRQKVIEG